MEVAEQLFVYERKASRIELFIRIVYSIAIWIVLMVYGIVAEICLFIQWFVILMLGRRSEGLSNFVKGYLEYVVHVVGYIYWMTDKRPGTMPKTVEIYAKRKE
jgi:amino acid permease